MSDGASKLTKLRLERLTGRTYWRSLEEWAEQSAACDEQDSPEFPAWTGLNPRLERRKLFRLIGANLALAGLTACGTRHDTENLLPYVREPQNVVPGQARYYATSQAIDGYATGILVETHEGRPTKIDGNPDHPASLGATTVFQQAALLQLYDVHRGGAVLYQGDPVMWNQLQERLLQGPDQLGHRLRIVLEPTSSSTVLRMLQKLRDRFPALKVTFHATATHENTRRGGELLFGAPQLPLYDLSHAKVIAAFDDDFLGGGPSCLSYGRQWASRRRLTSPEDEMNRMYVAESMSTVTGSMADERVSTPSSSIPRLMAMIAAELLGSSASSFASVGEASRTAHPPGTGGWVKKLVSDLRRHGKDAVVMVGERQPAAVHVLAQALNAKLGSLGQAVWMIEPAQIDLGDLGQDLSQLVAEMRSGHVDAVIILGSNPSYTAPVDLEFGAALRRARFSMCLGMYYNETARDCQFYVPQSHFLETWGDARAYDGTRSVVQPVIQPLFNSHSDLSVLALLLGQARASERDLVRESFSEFDDTQFEWLLQRGLLDGSAAPRTTPTPRSTQVADALRAAASVPSAGPSAVEVDFVLDSKTYDGRFSNNPWLQELAHPITKIAWDNAAYMSPATAARFQLENEQLIRLTLGDRNLVIAVWVVPGHADDAITLPLGYGRRGVDTRIGTEGERIGYGVGFNTYMLRTTQALHYALGASIELVYEITDVVGTKRRSVGRPTSEFGPTSRSSIARYPIATTQRHWETHGRPIALTTTLDEYRKEPDFTKEHKGEVLSLLPPTNQHGLQWAMSIDLTVCTGCSACVVACFAENNIMMVGKQGVRESREMHWLRIDTYYTGSPDQPTTVHQPMACQHCEKAPCEYVCPVNATVHSPDGLNEMIYNRCIGTRFCSNNCPYKVRRFNWFNWQTHVPELNATPLLALVRNPEVTVRERGVMEKCTYCVQRLRTAQIRSQVENRPFHPEGIQTACQQACPTRAIEFGSLDDDASAMVRYRHQPRSYAVLHDQGTQPRTMYLARVDNKAPSES